MKKYQTVLSFPKKTICHWNVASRTAFGESNLREEQTHFRPNILYVFGELIDSLTLLPEWEYIPWYFWILLLRDGTYPNTVGHSSPHEVHPLHCPVSSSRHMPACLSYRAAPRMKAKFWESLFFSKVEESHLSSLFPWGLLLLSDRV